MTFLFIQGDFDYLDVMSYTSLLHPVQTLSSSDDDNDAVEVAVQLNLFLCICTLMLLPSPP